MPLLDAHAHFFDPGYVGILPEDCRRRVPTEITLYAALARQHDVSQVLAVGYEGDPWAAGNNAYLAAVTAQHPWVRPVAFVVDIAGLTRDALDQWHAQGFVGLSLYLFAGDAVAALQHVPDATWRWLTDHAWLLSVNSTGIHWQAWQPVLDRHPEIRLLIAHLGLPPAMKDAPSPDVARDQLANVLALAAYPHTYVKFSGFYALAEPSYAYPHHAAWPYAQAISAAFGPSRILWASDFSPALEHVSFPQTIATVRAMPWLATADHDAIFHDNLARLLNDVAERSSAT